MQYQLSIIQVETFFILHHIMHTQPPSGANNFLYPPPTRPNKFSYPSLVNFWNFPNMMPRSAKNAFWGQKSALRADKFSYPPVLKAIIFLSTLLDPINFRTYLPTQLSCRAR